LKFSNVIVATASLVLVGLILDAFLLVALASEMGAFIIAMMVASLIIGYVFALGIQEESRIRAVGVIVVLSALTFLTFNSIWIANPFASPWFGESLNSAFNTSGWTNYDKNAHTALLVSVVVIIASVITFIGLYIGSMLRKPSVKTKE
jgi:hypothetical protein